MARRIRLCFRVSVPPPSSFALALGAGGSPRGEVPLHLALGTVACAMQKEWEGSGVTLIHEGEAKLALLAPCMCCLPALCLFSPFLVQLQQFRVRGDRLCRYDVRCWFENVHSDSNPLDAASREEGEYALAQLGAKLRPP